MEKLSASLEDYLEIICNYAQLNKKIRAVDISKKLNISRASTTEALKKLASKGYINYERYETISLTESGKEIAQKVVSKHLVLQEFFEQTLGLSKEEASYNACKIEHVITDNAFNKIVDFLEKGRV
ncbi:MAG: metal-dependent transcriptional regulator [Candidatus Gastranaerophilales bacterium]|jgi:DtxR family Mn-dependent transcriptional regulator|nr:metal-dependent transcriptional regulator [Candidatus Gastranaerophilales bacterium]